MTENKKSLLILGVCLVGLIGGYTLSEWGAGRLSVKDGNISYNKSIQQGTENPFMKWAQDAKFYRETNSGNYLAAHFAQSRNDWTRAHDFMSRVLEGEAGNPDLTKHAMVLAMGAGKSDEAFALAQEVLNNNDKDLLATLFLTAQHFQKEDYKAVPERLKNMEQDQIASFIIPVLKLWAESSDSKPDFSRLGRNNFYVLQAMLAGLYSNQKDAALIYAADNLDLSATDIRDIESLADAYAALGKPEQAKKFYDLLMEQKFGNDQIKKKIEAIESGKPLEPLLLLPVIKTPKDGAAEVFKTMAIILMREQSMDSALLFIRMALNITPDMVDGRLLLARILIENEQYESAIAEFEKIPQGNPYHSDAMRGIANIYMETKETDKAIAILEKLYADYDDRNALNQIGDIHRFNEDYSKAVKAYDRIITLFPDGVPEEYWHVLYARGMAHERLKNFKQSEEDLLTALDFRPDHPYLLNYLGYSWADQGVHLDRAMDMLIKAFEIKPDDGYIADSLGWVHYRLDNFEDAILYLEKAVELLPYDATINDHLGDAYWQVGRKTEARFQWQRAVNNAKEEEAELRSKIAVKLTHGLLDDAQLAALAKDLSAAPPGEEQKDAAQ